MLIQQLINGLTLGAIYALIALGYTMVYGVMGLINFAHGEIYMIGAYIGLFLIGRLNFLPALVGSMLFCSILGLVIEKIAYRPLRYAPRLSCLITALGVSITLQAAMLLLMGPAPRSYSSLTFFEENFITFMDVRVSYLQILILLISLILMYGLQYFIKKTKTGKAMRAVSQDKITAKLMGINIDNIISITFAIGSALGGAAGVLVGIYYSNIFPYMGAVPGIKAFAAAILGGIGIIPGAMLGGIILGITEIFVVAFLSSSYRDVIAFALLVIVLLIKPTGILGKREDIKL